GLPTQAPPKAAPRRSARPPCAPGRAGFPAPCRRGAGRESRRGPNATSRLVSALLDARAETAGLGRCLARVCSEEFLEDPPRLLGTARAPFGVGQAQRRQIGRASCRERRGVGG